MNKRLKITVGIPMASEYLHKLFVQSLINLQYPENSDIQMIPLSGFQLPFARNRIVEEALAYGSEYVMFIDSDMTFPPDLILRLLKHDKDLVNALAFRRIHPHYPCIFQWNEKDKCYETMGYSGGLQEVDATGMAAHLIKTDVFKKMKKPWYYYRDHLFSSDLTFCENVRKAGFKIYSDTDLKIGHIGESLLITENFYLEHLRPEEKEKWNKGVRDFVEKHRARDKENYQK